MKQSKPRGRKATLVKELHEYLKTQDEPVLLSQVCEDLGMSRSLTSFALKKDRETVQGIRVELDQQDSRRRRISLRENTP